MILRFEIELKVYRPDTIGDPVVVRAEFGDFFCQLRGLEPPREQKRKDFRNGKIMLMI